MAHRGRHSADDLFALALATGQTVRGAAETAKISERTATRRWADPAFRRRVFALRADIQSQATGLLVDALGHAVRELVVLLGDPDPTVRIRAARSILEYAANMQAQSDVNERLAALEQQRLP